MSRYVVAGLMVLGVTGVVVGGLEAKTAPKVIVIDKCKSKRSGVTFKHAFHVKTIKVKCKTCHHNKGKVKTCSGSGCHKGKAKGDRPGCAELSLKKNPYHIACIGCHKKRGKGPKKCKQCHR
jgi:Class III cytochrome C family